MELRVENIDKAHELAYRACHDVTISQPARNIFRAIAHQIWLSTGSTRPTETQRSHRAETCAVCIQTEAANQ